VLQRLASDVRRELIQQEVASPDGEQWQRVLLDVAEERFRMNE
jgi:hypothetical protein